MSEDVFWQDSNPCVIAIYCVELRTWSLSFRCVKTAQVMSMRTCVLNSLKALPYVIFAHFLYRVAFIFRRYELRYMALINFIAAISWNINAR